MFYFNASIVTIYCDVIYIFRCIDVRYVVVVGAYIGGSVDADNPGVDTGLCR